MSPYLPASVRNKGDKHRDSCNFFLAFNGLMKRKNATPSYRGKEYNSLKDAEMFLMKLFFFFLFFYIAFQERKAFSGLCASDKDRCKWSEWYTRSA